MSKNSPLSFEQASAKDLNYLVQKTLELHNFEIQDSNIALSVNNNFKEEIETWLAAELELQGSLIFLFYLEDNCIGFAFIKLLPSPNRFTDYSSYGLIQSIWIDEPHRNEKLGRQVVDFIESIFKEQQTPYYEVSYEKSNKTAESFWQKCGLAPASVTARKFLT